MLKRVPALFLLCVAMESIVGLAACGKKSSSSSGATVTSVSITPTAISVPINNQADFTATVNLSNKSTSTTTTVTWLVNGVAGGNSSIGTIVPLSMGGEQVGKYTAPASVPTTNNGQVNITATAPQSPSNSSDTTVVTSNTAIVTVTIGQGLQVTPAATTVPAGGNFQFSAILNGVADPDVTWSVTANGAANVGMIDPNTGLFTAPPSPPPGGSATIVATAGAVNAAATARIVYSDESLGGPFAFGLVGNDSTGFSAVAGSFVSDGQGHITSGVEDIDSFSGGVSTQVAVSGTYSVNADGRGTIIINSGLPTSATLRFALTTAQHGILVRFDQGITASGTMDQQNVSDLTNSPAVISGPYVFIASGADSGFKPFGVAGKFSADGFGDVSNINSIVDKNDDGTLSTSDRTLSGSYAFDASFPGSGRGVLTLTSTGIGQLQYAFYIVDSTRLYLVEIDANAFAAGNVFQGAPGDSFSTASLASGNYAFEAGGTLPAGPLTLAGVFGSSGSGGISGGTAESDNAGSVQTDVTMGACTYTVDQATGRIDLSLNFGGGTCTVGAKGTANFAAYQTVQGSAVMLEIDALAVSSGMFFAQTSTSPLDGNFALSLAGQGIVHNSPGSIQQNVEGQLILNGAAVSAGNLDINNFNAVFGSDPIGAANSSIVAPGANGRGTAVLSASDPSATYNLVYYVVDANSTVLFDKDSNLILIGALARQF